MQPIAFSREYKLTGNAKNKKVAAY